MHSPHDFGAGGVAWPNEGSAQYKVFSSRCVWANQAKVEKRRKGCEGRISPLVLDGCLSPKCSSMPPSTVEKACTLPAQRPMPCNYG